MVGNEGEGAGMDKGWSPIWAHWTPAVLVGKVRMRAQTVNGKGRKDTTAGFIPPPGLQLSG